MVPKVHDTNILLKVPLDHGAKSFKSRSVVPNAPNDLNKETQDLGEESKEIVVFFCRGML